MTRPTARRHRDRLDQLAAQADAAPLVRPAARTVGTTHYVPTLRYGAWCPLDRLLMGHAIDQPDPSVTWVGYSTVTAHAGYHSRKGA
jgi:hypothetical protein